jgi:hypothetical protein
LIDRRKTDRNLPTINFEINQLIYLVLFFCHDWLAAQRGKLGDIHIPRRYQWVDDGSGGGLISATIALSPTMRPLRRTPNRLAI